MKLFIKKTKNTGYTIIETMIAVSLFLVIIMVGMGALLNTNLIHQKSQNTRSIIDNLSFIMEEISRNLRVGYNYHCGNDLNNITTPMDCSDGVVIAFESATGDINNATDQWVYKIDSDDGGVTYNISKSTNSGATFVKLNSSLILIETASSSFSVIGALPPPDALQPYATIKLAGKIIYKNIETPFSLETSVSQRLIDR